MDVEAAEGAEGSDDGADLLVEIVAVVERRCDFADGLRAVDGDDVVDNAGRLADDLCCLCMGGGGFGVGGGAGAGRRAVEGWGP